MNDFIWGLFDIINNCFTIMIGLNINKRNMSKIIIKIIIYKKKYMNYLNKSNIKFVNLIFLSDIFCIIKIFCLYNYI